MHHDPEDTVDDRVAIMQYYEGNHFLNARHKCETVNFETSLCTMLSFKGFLKGITLTSSTVSSSSAS